MSLSVASTRLRTTCAKDRLAYLPGVVRVQPFGNTDHGSVLRRRGDESVKKQACPLTMIDDFRLWGSRRCRRGVSALQTWGRTPGPDTWAGHDFNYHNASLSESVFSRHCGRTSPKRSTGRGTTPIPRVRCGKAKRGCASRVPLPRTAAARCTRRGAGGGSDPRLFAADAPRAGARPDRRPDTLPPLYRGSLPPQ